MIRPEYPLYVVRQYESVYVEGIFKVITTARSKYILDLADTYGMDTYLERRLALISMDDLPYKIYPLGIRIDNFADFIHNRKHKKFIDAKGRLVSWDTSRKYFPIEYRQIVSWSRSSDNYYIIRIENSSATFKVKNPFFKYAAVVQIKPFVFELYALTDFKDKGTRIKI